MVVTVVKFSVGVSCLLPVETDVHGYQNVMLLDDKYYCCN